MARGLSVASLYTALSGDAFTEKVVMAESMLSECTICPRQCRVNRMEGETGFCKTGSLPFVSSWGPHFGEERPLVGRFGSGTVFFGNCNLGCLFCQNYSISHLGEGSEISHDKLARVMLSLQEGGCHNINFVTPTHQVPAILRGVQIAAAQGLRVPLVYNCGGYEALETLRILDGVIDIYMPDFKYARGEHAGRYSEAPDYPEVAKDALREMHRQVGDLVMDDQGIATRGLLVRHLILPEDIAGTADVVRFIAGEISKDTYINIMDQYHPCYQAFENPPLNRRITGPEYSAAVKAALEAGLTRIDGVTT